MPPISARPPNPPALPKPEVTVHHKDDRILNFNYVDWWIRALLAAILLVLIFSAHHAHGQGAEVAPVGLYQWNGTKFVPVNATNPLSVSASFSGSTYGATFPPTGTPIGGENAGLFEPLTLDGSGNILVNCATGCGASSFADNAAFTAGTTPVTITAGWYSTSPTNCTSGSACAPQLSIDRKLYVLDFQGTNPWQVSQPLASLLNATVVGTGTFITQSENEDGSGNAITSNSTTTTSTRGLDLNIRSILNTAPTTAGFLDIKGADGNVFVRQTTAASLNATVVGLGSAGTPSGGVVSVQGVSGGQTLPVSGTLAVTQSTSPWIVAGNDTPADAFATPTNAVPAQDFLLGYNGSTSDRLRTAGIGNAVAATGILAVAAYGQNNTSLPTLGNTNYGVEQLDTSSRLITVGAGTVGTPAGGVVTVQGVSGGSTLGVGLTSWGGTNLGTPTNFGSTPGAVIAGGVNSSLFVSTTAVRTNQTTTATGVLDVNLVGTLGATNSATNGAFSRLTDNTTAITAAVSALGTAPTGTDVMAVNNVALPSTAAGAALTATAESALTTAVVVKASAGNLYGFQVTNGAASVCYLQFINVASAPTLGTASTYSFAVPASGTLTLQPGSLPLSNYTAGISVGMSTAFNGASACGTAATAVIFYK
jgi:hypothetical protein